MPVHSGSFTEVGRGALWGASRPLSPSSHPPAALEEADDEEVLLIEDTLSSHTDLMDNEPVLYEVQKQFMR